MSYENFDGEVTPDLLAMPDVERKKLPLDVQLKIWKHLKKGAPLNETAIKKSHKQNLNHQPQALGDKTNMARTVSAGPTADPFKDSVKKSVLPPSNPPFEQHPKISGKKERKAHHQSTATASSFSVFQDDVKGSVAADPIRPIIAFDKVLGVVDRIDDLADWMNSLTSFFESLNTSIQGTFFDLPVFPLISNSRPCLQIALPELKNIKDSLEMSMQSIKNSNEYLKSDWHEIIQEASGLQSALAETMQENEALNDKISVLEEELLMAKNIDDDDKMDVTDDQVAGSNNYNNNGEADLNESEFDGRYLCQNQDNSMVYNDAPFCPQSIQDASCQTDYHMDSVLTMAKSFAFQSRLLNDQVSLHPSPTLILMPSIRTLSKPESFMPQRRN